MSYLGISPPRTRDFAATLRGTSDDARALAVDLARLLDAAQLTSAGPAVARDVALTMGAAADVLEQRATLADLCRTDPGVLATNLAASQDALWALLVDDQGANLLDAELTAPSANGTGTEVIDRLWDLLGTGSTMSSLASEMKAAARFGIVFRLQMEMGRLDAPRLAKYLGPLLQSPQGQRLLVYLAGSEANAALIAREVKSLNSALTGLADREAVTAIGKWYQATFPRLAGATKGVGRVSGVFFTGMEAIQLIDAMTRGDITDVSRHALGLAAGVLLLCSNPIFIGVGAVILTGLLIYDNWDWIERNLSLTGLANIGTEVLDGIDTGLQLAFDTVGNTVDVVKDAFTDGLRHAVNPMH